MSAHVHDISPDADPSIVVPVPEHDDLRTVVRQIVAQRASIDQVLEAIDSVPGHSPGLWTLLNSELDVSAMAVPEALGGVGFGLRELAVVLEETGAALLPEPLLASAVLGAQALLLADHPEDVAPVLAEVASGREIATVAVAGTAATALVVADHGTTPTVSGRVDRVLQAGVARHLIAPASTADGDVLVLMDLDHPGAIITERQVMDSTRRQADVAMTDVPVTVLVSGSRFATVQQSIRDLARIGLAAEHVGMVTHLLQLTTDYVNQREQFGRQIGSFQAIKHRLADVLVDRERARSAARYAAAVFAQDPSKAALPAAIAASICQDAVIRTAHEAIQLHGGIGFTWEHSAHLYVRRALGDEGLFGDSRSHRADIADLIGI